MRIADHRKPGECGQAILTALKDQCRKLIFCCVRVTYILVDQSQVFSALDDYVY